MGVSCSGNQTKSRAEGALITSAGSAAAAGPGSTRAEDAATRLSVTWHGAWGKEWRVEGSKKG